MELAVISKEEALFQIEELPEMVRSMLGHDTVVFAARDDFGNVISSAVYSYSDAYRNEAWLVWFYTIPEYRFLNAASRVLSFGEQELLEQGIRQIRVSLRQPMEEAVSLYYFLTHMGYQPVSLGYHMMQYDVSSVTGCSRIQKFIHDPQLMPMPVDAEQLGYLLRENPQLPAAERDRLRFLADPARSLFYGRGGHLDACVPVCQEQTQLRVMELYVGPKITRPAARLTMLAQLAQTIRNLEEPPEQILLETEDPRLTSLYRGLFGREKADIRAQQYIRYL